MFLVGPILQGAVHVCGEVVSTMEGDVDCIADGKEGDGTIKS